MRELRLNVTIAAPTSRMVAIDLLSIGVKAGSRTAVITNRYGRKMHGQVRRNATHRPGPHRITGRYYNSIRYQFSAAPTGATATVVTDDPRSWRLEEGFSGTDSRGRSYHQPAYPHFRPAFEQIAPQYMVALATVLQ